VNVDQGGGDAYGNNRKSSIESFKNTANITPIIFRIVMNCNFPRCGRGLEFRPLQNNSVFNENLERGWQEI
jgi:hypothetical protein